MDRTFLLLTVAARLMTGIVSSPPGMVVYPAYPLVFVQPAGTFSSLQSRVHAMSPPSGSNKTDQHVLRVQGTLMPPPEQRVLWNFTMASNVTEWKESSDGTTREAGMSTGAFKLQKTARFQRAVMFSLLNPQPNGAGFVGFHAEGHWNLSQFRHVNVQCRGRGGGTRYTISMNHHDSSSEDGTYESHFEVPKNQLTTVSLPLSSLAFSYGGRAVPDAPPLDLADVARIGLQISGGVYRRHRQSGVSSLEIDWITVSN